MKSYESVLLAVAFLAILIGTITDIKKREVPDWISYFLIFFGIGARLLYSIYLKDFSILLQGVYGLILFSAIAYAMYYAGQWGGGDAKMLIGLGAVIGFEVVYSSGAQSIAQILNSSGISFLINTIVFGAFYGLFYILILFFPNRALVYKKFKLMNKDKDFIKYRNMAIVIGFIYFIIFILISKSLYYNIIAGIVILALIIVFPYLWAFVKSVEDAVMYKEVCPENLVEGDWIARDIVVGNKIIASSKDLGVSKEQIEDLKYLYKNKKISKVLVKEGIPFVPSFLIAFIVTIVYGNLFIWIF